MNQIQSAAVIASHAAAPSAGPLRRTGTSASKSSRTTPWVITILGILSLVACTGIAPKTERQARNNLQSVAAKYRPSAEPPPLPQLQTNSPFAEYLRFAILNQPQVEAAYFDWAASVEKITGERSLPDPRLTFQSDIQNVVLSLVPGLMMDIPGPGKLRLRADAASAESDSRYVAFQFAALQTAFSLKRAYYQLYFLDAKIAVSKRNLQLLKDLEKLADAQNQAGKVTLQDVLRAQIEQERLATEIANLEDSRRPLLAQFKAALGLRSSQSDPPQPQRFESTPLDLTPDQMLSAAVSRNPRLKIMEADVRRAEASLRLSYKSRVPDFTVGLEADAKASPVMYTPQLAMTLPIWRDKIAAEIAAAQAAKKAAQARLTSEQIALAVELAEKTFMFRESTRNLSLFNDQLIPKGRQSVEVARAGYLSGQIDFFNLISAEQTLLTFELGEVEARTQRELALAELSLLIVTPPPQAQILEPATFSLPNPQAPATAHPQKEFSK